MRVLHLVDQKNGQGCPTMFELLGQSLGRLGDVEQEVLLLGGEGIRGMAEAVGISDFGGLGVPSGRGFLGWSALLKRYQLMGDFHLIHCWSVGALSVAAILFPKVKKVLTLTSEPSGKTIKWLRVLSGFEKVGFKTTFLTISSTIRRELLAGGVDEGLVHVLRPGIDMSRVNEHARAGLREAWEVDENTRVIGLAADPMLRHSPVDFTWTVGLAAHSDEESGREYAVVLHPEHRDLIRCEKIMNQACPNGRLIVDERADQPWMVYPGCDMVYAQGAGGGGLSLIWAMASNRVIVGEATYGNCEALEDRHSAILAKGGKLSDIAHKLIETFDDVQTLGGLKDTARHEAYSYFSRSRYCEQLKLVYEQMMLGVGVTVAEIEVSGGLKFSGRG